MKTFSMEPIDNKENECIKKKSENDTTTNKNRTIVEHSNAVEAGAELSVSSSNVPATTTFPLLSQPGPSTSCTTYNNQSNKPLQICDEDIQYFLEDNAYAVVPVPDCPHLSVIEPIPESGINIKDPCTCCGSVQENWICLSCYSVYCSRYVNQHMLEHTKDAAHPVALSFSDISVWCYACDDYIDNEILNEAKSIVYRAKFGTSMPGYNC